MFKFSIISRHWHGRDNWRFLPRNKKKSVLSQRSQYHYCRYLGNARILLGLNKQNNSNHYEVIYIFLRHADFLQWFFIVIARISELLWLANAMSWSIMPQISSYIKLSLWSLLTNTGFCSRKSTQINPFYFQERDHFYVMWRHPLPGVDTEMTKPKLVATDPV